MSSRDSQGRHPRRGARHPLPAGDQEPAQGDAPRRRQAVDPVRGRRGGPCRAHRHPDHHRPGQARDRGPLRPQLRARVLPGAAGQARAAQGGAGVLRARRHPLHPPDATRSGSATRCRWRVEHVGDEPFAVMLGDDIMVDDSALLRSMLDVHDRYGRSVLALKDVSPRGDLLVRLCRARGGRGRSRARPLDRREAVSRRKRRRPSR